jgi:hypothetical protein
MWDGRCVREDPGVHHGAPGNLQGRYSQPSEMLERRLRSPEWLATAKTRGRASG